MRGLGLTGAPGAGPGGKPEPAAPAKAMLTDFLGDVFPEPEPESINPPTLPGRVSRVKMWWQNRGRKTARTG